MHKIVPSNQTLIKVFLSKYSDPIELLVRFLLALLANNLHFVEYKQDAVCSYAGRVLLMSYLAKSKHPTAAFLHLQSLFDNLVLVPGLLIHCKDAGDMLTSNTGMLSLNDKVADLPKSTLLDDGDNEAITASLTAQTYRHS